MGRRTSKRSTREEMAVMVSRLINLEAAKQEGASASFNDMTDAGQFAVKAIQDAVEAGIIQGRPDGSFHPKSALTRAEALQVLWNTLRLDAKIAALLDQLNA